MGQSKLVQIFGLYASITLVFRGSWAEGMLQSSINSRESGGKRRLELVQGDDISDAVVAVEDIHQDDAWRSNNSCYNVSVLSCKCSSYNKTIKLDCSNRNITRIPDNIPSNTIELILSGNEIENISVGVFRNLTGLKILDLSGNKIELFEDGSFTGLIQLEVLYLQDNHFNLSSSAFNENVFLSMTNLRELNVKARLSVTREGFEYPDKALAKLSSLQTLTIDGLSNITFGMGFRNLSNLRTLNLSVTPEFTSISEEMFQNFKDSPIETLLLNNCDLKWIHRSAFKYLTKIDTIDYSHNTDLHIEGVSRSVFALQHSTIRSLVFQSVHASTSFTEITANHVKYMKNTQIEKLYLDNNTISGFTNEALRFMPKSLKIFSISWNNIQTKVQQIALLLASLRNITEVNFSYQQSFSVKDNQTYTALGPIFIQQLNKAFLKSGDVKETPNFAIDFPPKLKRIECSNTYKLRFRIPSFTLENAAVEYADFSNNLLSSWEGPVYGLKELEYLDLSGNDCKYISTNFFDYVPKLKTLKIANNRLGPELIETLFDNLTSLKILDIGENKQERTLPGLFSRLRDLEELTISSNYLTSWTADLSGLTKLVWLNLSHNKFTSLPSALYEDLDSIAKHSHLQVDLRGNPLECVCGTKDFVSWFAQTQVKFSHLNSTMCKLENGTNISLTHKHTILNHLQKYCRSYTVLISVLSACVGTCLLVLICYLIRRNRWRIRYLFYTFTNRRERTGYQRLEGDMNEPQFFFDAFISYEDNSRNFIINEVIPRLETNAELKLCIDKRDFVPGMYITDNVMNAIKNSKKTVILLTKEFLKSKWCMYELNMALVEGIYSGRKILSIVLLEDIPVRHYSSEMLDLIARQTYIERVEDEFGTQLFWHKLIASIRDDTNSNNPKI